MAATNTTTTVGQIVCDECGTHAPTRPSGEPGETSCPQCGLILDEYRIDHGKPWTYYRGDTTNPAHAAPGNPNRADRGLGSQIGNHHERDGTRIARLHALSQKGTRKKDRNRGYATTEINRIGTSMGFTNPVIEDAKHHFQRLHHEGGVDGRDLDTLAAACLYASSRINGTGRVPSELAEVSRCSEQDISRQVWVVANELGLEIPPPDLEARLRVVAAKFDLRQSTVRDSIEDLRSLCPSDVSNGKPSGIVAAVLYRNTGLTQERVGDAAGVSEVTVRNARDRLYSD